MANEQELKDRWGNIFRGTAEYQTAQKRAAVSKAQKEQQFRSAMRNARGAGEAADIQRQMMESLREPDATVAGLDAFQNERAGKYINDTLTAAPAKAAAAGFGPGYGPNYRQSMLDPNFAEHVPYAELTQRGGMGLTKGEVAKNQADVLDWQLGGPEDALSVDRREQLAAERARLPVTFGAHGQNLSTEYGLDVIPERVRGIAENMVTRQAAAQKLLNDQRQQAARKEMDLAQQRENEVARFQAQHILTQTALGAKDKTGALTSFYDNLPREQQLVYSRMPLNKRIEAIQLNPAFNTQGKPRDTGTSRVSLVRNASGALVDNPDFGNAFRGASATSSIDPFVKSSFSFVPGRINRAQMDEQLMTGR